MVNYAASNRSLIYDPVLPLHLCFNEIDNTIVINGAYCFADIINHLEEDYLPNNERLLLVRAINSYKESLKNIQ